MVILIGINQAKQNKMHILTNIYMFIMKNETKPRHEFEHWYIQWSNFVYLI